MKSQFQFRIGVIAVVCIFVFLYTFPSIKPLWTSTFGLLSIDEQLAVPEAQISYEDLTEENAAIVTFKVNYAAAVFVGRKIQHEEVLINVAEEVRKGLVAKGFRAGVINPEMSGGSVTIRVQEVNAATLKQEIAGLKLYSTLPLDLARIFPRSRITLGLDLRGGIDLVYQIDTSSLDQAERENPADAVRRSVEIIRNRIDMYGIAEPSIQAMDGGRIRVQLPGVADPERVKDLIQTTAMLRFHLVIETAMSAAELQPIDQHSEIVLFEPGAQGSPGIWYKLEKKPQVTGRDLKYANVAFSDMASPIVHVEFNPEGAVKFSSLTRRNVGRLLAIVLDNTVRSAPRIEGPIPGGRAEIRGRFSVDEAQNLAITLRAGALPATLIEIDSRVVGPTLGFASIEAGIRAAVLGTILVLGFMALFYKTSGMIANVAVIFNTLIVFSVLVFFGGTLTLPGIAGLILSIGMAVDANVIIFERIKEELRTGKTVRASISAGFERALTCIFDSNITTLLTVAVLYVFASGPIRGFATTLGIGLIANVFTAVVCVKLALEMIYSRSKSAVMSI